MDDDTEARALPSVEIRNEDGSSLEEYAAISIAFEVRSTLVALARGDLALPLETRGIGQPYLKDYDAMSLNHPREWHRRFDISRALFIAALLWGQRVGGAVIVVDPSDLARLEVDDRLALLWDIRVATGFRQQGIGRALLDAAENGARDAGLGGIYVETQDVNVAACQLYAAAGFQLARVAPSAYPELPNETQLIWRKSLL